MQLTTLAKEAGVALPCPASTLLGLDTHSDFASPDTMPAAVEAKLFANEVALRAGATALQVGGGSAYLLDSPIQRIFRDAQAGALMAYSVPFARTLVGRWSLEG